MGGELPSKYIWLRRDRSQSLVQKDSSQTAFRVHQPSIVALPDCVISQDYSHVDQGFCLSSKRVSGGTSISRGKVEAGEIGQVTKGVIGGCRVNEAL